MPEGGPDQPSLTRSAKEVPHVGNMSLKWATESSKPCGHSEALKSAGWTRSCIRAMGKAPDVLLASRSCSYWVAVKVIYFKPEPQEPCGGLMSGLLRATTEGASLSGNTISHMLHFSRKLRKVTNCPDKDLASPGTIEPNTRTPSPLRRGSKNPHIKYLVNRPFGLDKDPTRLMEGFIRDFGLGGCTTTGYEALKGPQSTLIWVLIFIGLMESKSPSWCGWGRVVLSSQDGLCSNLVDLI